MARDGRVELADGSILRIKVLVVDVKEAGFSPFGGVNFVVRPLVGISAERVPEGLRNAVRDRYPASKIPEDGWEIVRIVRFENALQEVEVDTSRDRFRVGVEIEPLMVARNTRYKAAEGIDEPLYAVYWAIKVRWESLGGWVYG